MRTRLEQRLWPLLGLLGAAGAACSDPDGGGAGGTNGTSSTSTAGAAGAGGDAGAGGSGGSVTGGAGGAAPAPPTFESELTAGEQGLFTWRSDNGGGVTFGAANEAAGDGAVAALRFTGNEALGPDDLLSPEYATEIATVQRLHFGTYLARFQLARCEPTEELVNGVFTYFNDGEDHDADGLIDNSEIDIEVLCSDPAMLSLTIWSEYTSDAPGENVHLTREIDTATGDYLDTLNYDTVLAEGNLPDLVLAGFGMPDLFYELGFEWQASFVRYFIEWEGQQITLWSCQDAARIPTLPASFLFNVWHSRDWWNEEAPADYPASDGIMRVDRLRYWAH